MKLDKYSVRGMWLAAVLVAGCGVDDGSDTPDGGGADGSPDGSGESGGCVAIAETVPAVCSIAGDERRNVVFTNNCSEEIDIWWVTYGCVEKFYERLAPGR